MNENEMLQDDEISLFDLINQLLMEWKIWVSGAFIGLLIGFAFWLQKGFEAELAARPVRTLEFVQWRNLSGGLPALADTLSRAQGVEPEMQRLFDLVSETGWWKKNVTPDYNYSKSEIKDLSLGEKVATSNISRVVIRASAASKDDAIRKTYAVERFIQDGGAYLALKSLLSEDDFESNDVYAKVQAKISRDEVELAYLNKRADALESLRKKYPDNAKTVSQTVLDPNDNAAKYLPLGTQVVAVKTEINTIEESLSRSRDRLEEQKVIKQFLAKALPLLESETSGLALGAKLDEIEKEIRRSVNPANKQQILALNVIAEKLNGINTGYRQFFEMQSMTSARRASKLPLALGLIGGLLVGMISAFVVNAWQRDQERRTGA